MKKLVKILPILMVVATILMSTMPVLATTVGPLNVAPNTNSADNVAKIGNTVLGIIQVIGTVVAVGVLMVIGIKYMMGSAEEKAEYKKTMIPYLIGAVILFAAVNIAAYVVAIANTVV